MKSSPICFQSVPRSGLTLFEVVISLAILLVSMAAIAPLVATGSRAAINANLASEAALRCETKLAEILAGVEPMTPTASVPFVDSSSWTWTLEVATANGVDNLLMLTVTVRSADPAAGDQAVATLVRWTRDPSVFADAEEIAAAEQPTGSVQ